MVVGNSIVHLWFLERVGPIVFSWFKPRFSVKVFPFFLPVQDGDTN